MPASTPDFADLYTHAHDVLSSVLAACEPGALVAGALAELPTDRAVHLVAIGKASVRMCVAAHEGLGERIRFGICTSAQARLGKPAVFPPTVGLMQAEHPVPTAENMDAAEAVRFAVSEFGEAARRGDAVQLLALISGGGSAHLTLPAAGLDLPTIQALTQGLLRSAATIQEINTVRKHCEQLKGGRLATLAAPGPVTALVLSDVVGDDISAVASGPLAPDPTTYSQALAILKKHGLTEEHWAVADYLERGRDGEHPETPKPGDPVFARVEHRVIGGNDYAVLSASAAAERLGFRVVRAGCRTTGISREVGAALAREIRDLRQQGERGVAVVIGGETTVKVTGTGAGGRNQELALAAAIELAGLDRVAVLSFATDGVDGPTDAAGSIVTGQTVVEASRLGLSAPAHLENNDAYGLLARVERSGPQCLFKTGPTGTNVNDIAVALAY